MITKEYLNEAKTYILKIKKKAITPSMTIFGKYYEGLMGKKFHYASCADCMIKSVRELDIKIEELENGIRLKELEAEMVSEQRKYTIEKLLQEPLIIETENSIITETETEIKVEEKKVSKKKKK